MLENQYICWHSGQNEGDGKELKAPSIEAAAKKAVDIWRHENLKEITGEKVTVLVKDEDTRVHKIIVSGAAGDSSAPEAFH